MRVKRPSESQQLQIGASDFTIRASQSGVTVVQSIQVLGFAFVAPPLRLFCFFSAA